ncbi:MAG: hypothetical protein Nkreftii_001894 [Candidatus Nitrospira kreftii]|uniref:Uncharacterized protein n=1 Tax=Candidatus Nitrospira kreftii TaxID=2652173 RepID=A0A7S8FE23_9BACT|nr:MAG: hypothetical protein Nkreftii_001894 [Candidatus Nitrospira kreftii]
MRFLLAGILGLLPLTIHAASPDCPHIVEPGSATATDRSTTESPVVSPSLEGEVRFSGNPYSPASPTNFEPLIGPYLYVQGQEGIVLYTSRSFSHDIGRNFDKHF